MDFVGFSKIPRYSRECIITEKIDGTNVQIFIAENSAPITLGSGRVVPFLCGSRTRWIFPENDNHGFAKWAYENAAELLRLGPGRHFGEWWGQRINRNYGLKEKRFSLFNLKKWSDPEVRPACCGVVPILWTGAFETQYIEDTLWLLKDHGSSAVPGFMNPEGIVIFHTASGHLYKKTLENDVKGKGEE